MSWLLAMMLVSPVWAQEPAAGEESEETVAPAKPSLVGLTAPGLVVKDVGASAVMEVWLPPASGWALEIDMTAVVPAAQDAVYVPRTGGYVVRVTTDSAQETADVLTSVVNAVRVEQVPVARDQDRGPSPDAFIVQLDGEAARGVDVATSMTQDFDPERCIDVGLWRPYRFVTETLANPEYELARNRNELENVNVRVQRHARANCPDPMEKVAILVSASPMPDVPAGDSPVWETGVVVEAGLGAPDKKPPLGTPETLLWEFPVYETWQQLNLVDPAPNAASQDPTLPADPSDGAYQFHVYVAVMGADGAWVPRAPVEVWVQLEEEPSRFEWSVVTHPGAFNVAIMKCTDLLGSAPGAPTATATSDFYARRCQEQPDGRVLMDQVTLAPVAAHLRFTPYVGAGWLGLGVDVSVLALGTSGLVANSGQAVDNGLLSPFAVRGGVDLRLPGDSVNLTMMLGGGVALVKADGQYRFRPTFGITLAIPSVVAGTDKAGSDPEDGATPTPDPGLKAPGPALGASSGALPGAQAGVADPAAETDALDGQDPPPDGPDLGAAATDEASEADADPADANPNGGE